MPASVVLLADRLTKTYRTPSGADVHAIRDASFTLDAGGTLALVGPSGSGKTTLLGLCAGLDRATSGRVELAGRDLGPLSEDARAALRGEAVGFVFQNFQLIPTLTAIENVMVPAELRGTRGAPGTGSVRERAAALLADVGLEDRARHYPTELSGGEQQRVALARAFTTRPRVLFADEPTGNLDADTAALVESLLFRLNREAGTALVLVTHNPDLAAKCGTVLRLRGGAVVEAPALGAVGA